MKALELDDTLAEAHASLAYAEWFHDWDWASAEREFKRAVALNPNSAVTHSRYAECLQTRARFNESVDLYPNIAEIRAFVAWAYAMKGMYPRALVEYGKISDRDKAVAAEKQLVAGGLGWVYAVSGRRADALKVAKEFKDLSSHTYVDFYQLATIYAGLGEKDEAFRLLEKGYEEHSATMPYLAVEPFWYGMRSDPRYADLLRRIGLPR